MKACDIHPIGMLAPSLNLELLHLQSQLQPQNIDLSGQIGKRKPAVVLNDDSGRFEFAWQAKVKRLSPK